MAFRVRRAVVRQVLPVIGITLLIGVIGTVYDVSGGVRPFAAGLFWGPLGLALALGYALVAEISRNTVTSLSSFGKHRGYAILGAAPELSERTVRQLPPDKRSPRGCVTFQPASPFATAFRDLQGALPSGGVVAFISALPDEGATTAALCTALSAAQQDRRVIVLDCDLRRRALSRALEAADEEEGVLQASENPARWRDYLGEEEETGLHFIPAGRSFNPWRTLATSHGFSDLIGELSRVYDLVVLDCPPALNNADGAIIASLARTSVVVTAWDRTPITAVRNAMRALQRQQSMSTGVYVNRVPPGFRFGRLRPD